MSSPRQNIRVKAALLKPAARAYGLAYLLVVGPPLLKLSLALYSRKGLSSQTTLHSIYRIFSEPLVFRGFPSFCGLLVGLSTLLQPLFKLLGDGHAPLYKYWPWRRHQRANALVVRFLSTLIAAWSGLPMLQVPGQMVSTAVGSQGAKEEEANHTPAGTCIATDQKTAAVLCVKRPVALAGRTIDLTLFAVVRALDSSLGLLSSHYRDSLAVKEQTRSSKWPVFAYADVALFVVSSGIVMDSWFYRPDALPKTYREWIRSAAQVDDRLVQVLRQARRGEFVYGEKSEKLSALRSLCEDYRLPLAWSDPATTIPIPCELVHMGTGPSCHWHALTRLIKAFKFALAMYLPLQVLLQLRRPSRAAMLGASKAALRSSMFLASFISLFYYGVCLCRTQLGPRIFPSKFVSPMMWEQGLCVRAGCLLCGWSILIESKRRRQEIALFVAPRAATTFLPRQYDSKYFWRERTVFSVGVALLFTLAYEDPRRVRGMLGSVLHNILHSS